VQNLERTYQENGPSALLKSILSAPCPLAFGSVLILPLCYFTASLAALFAGGPLWLWFNVDPDYIYLLDSLNILNLTAPGHIYHPGTTVQMLGALIIKIANPLLSSDVITVNVLADPEFNLRLIGIVFVGLNTLAVFGLGMAAYWVFGDLLAACFVQIAPFISMLILKNSYHAKPEALLLFTMLVLLTAGVLSLKPGLLDANRYRFATTFGIIAGFGVATKITAFPVFLLPLFVLWQWRAIAVYCAVAFFALVIFTLPALAAFDVFYTWIAGISQKTGAYGSGSSGYVDWGEYPKSVFKLFKRPAFHIVFILSCAMLALTAWRRRIINPLPVKEMRLLSGIVIAQFAHVLLIAKQPSAHYLIPSFVMITTAFVLAWRLATTMLMDDMRKKKILRQAVGVLFVVLIGAQSFSVLGLAKELSQGHKDAYLVDNSDFSHCARVYTAAASSRSFALMMSDDITGANFSSQLASQGPANDFWLEHKWHDSPLVFRDWRGPVDITAALQRYPCAIFRGSRWNILDQQLPELMPELKFDHFCSTNNEKIGTIGVTCKGLLLP
jgi:hypothetical protein